MNCIIPGKIKFKVMDISVEVMSLMQYMKYHNSEIIYLLTQNLLLFKLLLVPTAPF